MFLLKDKKPPVNKLLDVVLMVKLGKTDILTSLIILLQLIRIANFTITGCRLSFQTIKSSEQ